MSKISSNEAYNRSAMPALSHGIVGNIKFVVHNKEIINRFEEICN